MGLVDSKRVQRLYEQVLAHRRNCAFEDLRNLLLALDFRERKTAGSHVVFKRGRLAVTIPKRKPVKENYVAQVIAIVVELQNTG